MNQRVFVSYSGTIPLQAKRDLKLTRLPAIISLYQAKSIKHNKSNTTFLHEIVIFPPFYFSETTYVISSFNLRIELQNLVADAIIIPLIYRSPQGKTVNIAFINMADCPKSFSFSEHPSTSKFVDKVIRSMSVDVQQNSILVYLYSIYLFSFNDFIFMLDS